MKRDAQAVVLLLLGGTLIKISVNGTYVRYVKVGLRPLLLLAGAVLIVVAAATLWRAIRTPVPVPVPAVAVEDADEHDEHEDADEHDEHDENGDDGHAHAQPRVGWLLLAPALALLLFAPPAIGSFQAGRNGTALNASAKSDFAPLTGEDPVPLTMLDYASRAVFDKGRSLVDHRVRLTGFVIAGPGGQPYLARMIVTCCAADARPIKVGLTGALPAGLAKDQWLEVTGVYTDRMDKDPVNGEAVPYLLVGSTRQITPPEQQYES